MYYQPQFDILAGRPVGFEALVRWHHPVRGLLTPDSFLPTLVDSAVLGKLCQFAITSAMRDLAPFPEYRVSVNVTVQDLKTPAICEVVAEAAHKHAFDPRRLCLELTETAHLDDSAEVVATMDQLKRLGVQLAVDDFGTGYSGLHYLLKQHFDELKIDRSFIARLDTDTAAVAIVRNVFALAHDLNKRVVAEGVETDRQLKRVHELGLSIVQGYLTGRPMAARAMERMLTRFDSPTVAAVA